MTTAKLDRRFCIAPMMDWTDRHCRYLHRLIFPQAMLYTEMITSAAIEYGDSTTLLAYDPLERPLALQLGGSNPQQMAAAARLAEELGYDEVNINVGCPSDRVQSGAFGACLMAKPDVVAACVEAMRRVTQVPITVKTRVGIDEMQGYAPLKHFVSVVASAGCEVFVVHARKAWLKGLSPRQNREIPPLQYELVHQLKADFQHLQIVINGGLQSVEGVCHQLQFVDGVMVGRAAYNNPYAFVSVRNAIFSDQQRLPARHELVGKYLEYVDRQLQQGVYLKHMSRHLLGLFQGVAGAKRWRRTLSELAVKPGAGRDVIEQALSYVIN